MTLEQFAAANPSADPAETIRNYRNQQQLELLKSGEYDDLAPELDGVLQEYAETNGIEVNFNQRNDRKDLEYVSQYSQDPAAQAAARTYLAVDDPKIKDTYGDPVKYDEVLSSARAAVEQTINPIERNKARRAALDSGDTPFAVFQDPATGEERLDVSPALKNMAGNDEALAAYFEANPDLDVSRIPEIRQKLKTPDGFTVPAFQIDRQHDWMGAFTKVLGDDKNIARKVSDLRAAADKGTPVNEALLDQIDTELGAYGMHGDTSPEAAAERKAYIKDFINMSAAPEVDEENLDNNIRTLSTGQKVLPMAVMLQRPLFDKVVASPSIPESQRTMLKENRDAQISAMAPEMFKTIAANRPLEFPAFMQERKDKGLSNAAILDEWMADPDNYSQARSFLGGMGESVLDAAAAYSLYPAAMAGNEKALSALTALQKSDMDRRNYAQMFGKNLSVGYDLARILAPVAADVAVTMLSGGAATAAVTAKNVFKAGIKTAIKESVEMGAYKAFTRGAGMKSVTDLLNGTGKKVAQRFSPLDNAFIKGTVTASYLGTAFNRSAGSTYVQLYSQLSEEKNPDGSAKYTPEKAREIALNHGLIAGTMTAAITGGFSFLGAGGIESIYGNVSRKQLGRIFDKVKQDFDQLAPSVRAGLDVKGDLNDFVTSVAKKAVRPMLSEVGKGFKDEALEEGLDQFAGYFNQQIATGDQINIADAFKQAGYAAMLGGAMGGTVVGIKEAVSGAPDVNTEALARRTALYDIAAKLDAASSPRTAEAIRRFAVEGFPATPKESVPAGAAPEGTEQAPSGPAVAGEAAPVEVAPTTAPAVEPEAAVSQPEDVEYFNFVMGEEPTQATPTARPKELLDAELQGIVQRFRARKGPPIVLDPIPLKHPDRIYLDKLPLKHPDRVLLDPIDVGDIALYGRGLTDEGGRILLSRIQMTRQTGPATKAETPAPLTPEQEEQAVASLMPGQKVRIGAPKEVKQRVVRKSKPQPTPTNEQNQEAETPAPSVQVPPVPTGQTVTPSAVPVGSGAQAAATPETQAPTAVARDSSKPEQMTPEEHQKARELLRVKAETSQNSYENARLKKYPKAADAQLRHMDMVSTKKKLADDARAQADAFPPTLAFAVEEAINSKSPFSVAAYESVGMSYIPTGYVKQGELYVYQPEQGLTEIPNIAEALYEHKGINATEEDAQLIADALNPELSASPELAMDEAVADGKDPLGAARRLISDIAPDVDVDMLNEQAILDMVGGHPTVQAKLKLDTMTQQSIRAVDRQLQGAAHPKKAFTEANSPVTKEIIQYGGLEDITRFLQNVVTKAPKHQKDVAKLILEFGDMLGTVPITQVHLPNFPFSGAYIPETGQILINTAVPGPRGAVDTVLHELLHAATTHSIVNPTPAQQKVLVRLERIRQSVKKRAEKNGMKHLAYGLSSLDEMLTHFFTSPTFQADVSALTPKGERNWVQVIVEAIKDLLNGKVRTQQDKVSQEIMSDLIAFTRDAAYERYGPHAKTTDGRVLLLPAYHGTPHKVDRFSMSKIGTGEGAQAFGWGLYFAQDKKIAQWYADTLGSKAMPKGLTPEEIDARGIDNLTDDEIIASMQMWGAALQRLNHDEAIAKGVEWANLYGANEPTVKRIGDVATKYSDVIRGAGNLYEVELLVNDDQLLEWDLPLSEQSRAIQMAVRILAPTVFPAQMNPLSEKGSFFYQAMASRYRDDKVSEMLAKRGIKGIRFLDGNSRNRPYKDIKKDFLNALPEDAEFEDVQIAIDEGAFNADQTAFLKALEADDWFGFDYPAQAISAALSDKITNWDPSRELLDSIKALRGDVNYNYVIFDENDIQITAENGVPVTAAQATAPEPGPYGPTPRMDALMQLPEGDVRNTARFIELTRGVTPENVEQWRAENPEAYAELREMREEVLRDAGWDVGPVYHGAPRKLEGNRFDRSRIGMSSGVGRDGFSFTTNKKAAEAYSVGFSKNEEIVQWWANEVNKLLRTIPEDSNAEIWGMPASESLWDTGAMDIDEFSIGGIPSNIREMADEIRDTEPEVAAKLDQLSRRKPEKSTTGQMYETLLKLNNPRNLEASVDNMAEELWGVRASAESDVAVKLDDGENIYYVYSPESAKSTEPLNFDSDNQLILPHRWADAGSPDIRFQLPEGDGDVERVDFDNANELVSTLSGETGDAIRQLVQSSPKLADALKQIKVIAGPPSFDGKVIRLRVTDNTQRTKAHEVTHAILDKAIDEIPSFKKEVKDVRSSVLTEPRGKEAELIRTIFRQALTNYDLFGKRADVSFSKYFADNMNSIARSASVGLSNTRITDADMRLAYALTGEHEFLAAIMSDEGVREIAKRALIGTQEESLFKKLMNAIKKILGMRVETTPKNQLERVTKLIEDVINNNAYAPGPYERSYGRSFQLPEGDGDAEYLATVERGDMETAQRMVDEAARAAGLTEGIHGTSEDFDSFQIAPYPDVDHGFPAAFFGTSDYGYGSDRNRRRVIRAFLDIRKPLDLRGKNPKGPEYAEAQSEYQMAFDRARNAGRVTEDSVILGSEIDRMSFDSLIVDERDGRYSFAVFDPSQIKSADPVTYDDQGNVIPLSQRFNTASPDIRFQLPDPEQSFNNEIQKYVTGNWPADAQGRYDELKRFTREYLLPITNVFQVERELDSDPAPNNIGRNEFGYGAAAYIRGDDTIAIYIGEGNTIALTEYPQFINDTEFDAKKAIAKEIDTLVRDAEYLAAVKRGDMETAQRMVDEAARAAGYDIQNVYHASSTNFNEFLDAQERAEANGEDPYDVDVEPGNLGTGFYFTPDIAYAKRFGTPRKFHLKITNMVDVTDEEIVRRGQEIQEEEGMSVGEVMDELITEDRADGAFGESVGGLSYGASEYMVKASKQAKLADPVTYDDQGNVIPLSQRFNIGSPDIRFQIPEAPHSPDLVRAIAAGFTPDDVDLDINFDALIEGTKGLNPVNREHLIAATVNRALSLKAGFDALGDDVTTDERERLTRMHEMIMSGYTLDSDIGFYRSNPTAMQKLVRFLTAAVKAAYARLKLRFDNRTAVFIDRMTRELSRAKEGYRTRSTRKMFDPADPDANRQDALMQLPEGDMDAEYLAAVERGDMETAQQMVDSAAESAGYNKIVTHQTNKTGIEIFDRNAGGKGVYEWDNIGIWTTGRGTPQIYGPVNMELYGRMTNPKRYRDLGAYDEMVREYLSVAYPEAMWELNSDEIESSQFVDKFKQALKKLAKKAKVPEWSGSPKYQQWLKKKFPGAEGFRKYLKDQGYDGIQIDGAFWDGEVQTVRIFFEPEQLKSSDPVTYEKSTQDRTKLPAGYKMRRITSSGKLPEFKITSDEGFSWNQIALDKEEAVERAWLHYDTKNPSGTVSGGQIVIPLSQRFNTASPDIRFQLPEPGTEYTAWTEVDVGNKLFDSDPNQQPRGYFGRMFKQSYDLRDATSAALKSKKALQSAAQKAINVLSAKYQRALKEGADPDLLRVAIGSNKPMLTLEDELAIEAEFNIRNEAASNIAAPRIQQAQKDRAAARRRATTDEERDDVEEAYDLAVQNAKALQNKAFNEVAEWERTAMRDRAMTNAERLREQSSIAMEKLKEQSPIGYEWAFEMRKTLDEIITKNAKEYANDRPELAWVMDNSQGVYLVRTFNFHRDPTMADKLLHSTDPAFVELQEVGINFFGKHLADLKVEELRENPAYADYDELSLRAQALTEVRGEAKKLFEDYVMGQEGASAPAGSGLHDIRTEFQRFLRKKDLPDEILQILGEIDDPLFNSMRTFSSVTGILFNQRMLKAVRKDGLKNGWLIDEATKTADKKYSTWVPFVAANEKSESYAPLAGLYAAPKDVEALKAALNVGGRMSLDTAGKTYAAANRALIGAAGLSMGVMTLGSVGYFSRNMVGGVLLALSQGTNPASKLGWESMKTAYTASFGKNTDADVQELIARRVLGDGVNITYLKEFLQKYREDPINILQWAEDKGFKLNEQALDKLKSAEGSWTKMTDFLSKAAEFTETFQNPLIYFSEFDALMESGLYEGNEEGAKQEAARRTKMVTPGKSENPQAVTQFSKNPLSALVAPFIRFKAEMMRTTWNTYLLAYQDITSGNATMRDHGINRMQSAIVVHGALTIGLPLLMQYVLGISDEEDEAIRKGMPSYSRNSTFVYFKNKETGAITTWDLSFANPFSFVFDPFTQVIKAGGREDYSEIPAIATRFVTSDLMGEQIVAGKALDVSRNIDESTGLPIYMDVDNMVERFTKSAMHILEGSYTPQVLRKSAQAIQATYRPDTDEEPFFYTPLGILVGHVAPVRPRSHKPEDLAYRAFRNIQKSNAELWQITGPMSSPAPMDPEDVTGIYEKRKRAGLKVWQEMYRTGKAFQEMGLTQHQVARQATDAGLSKKRVGLALNGFMERPIIAADKAKDIKEIDERRLDVYREAVRKTPQFIKLD